MLGPRRTTIISRLGIGLLLLALIFSPVSTALADQTAATGRVIAWGYNNWGQATVPTGLTNVIAVAGGWFHSAALKADGTVVAWGLNDHGEATVPAGLTGVIAIAAGWHHTVALKGDGTVVAWGSNEQGQLNVPNGLSGVTAIAAGWLNTVALKHDGTVVAWGYNPYGESNVPAGLAGVTAIATSWAHVLALKQDGTVSAWGIDGPQTVVPTGLNHIVAVAAGGGHSVALKQDGTVVAWGGNDHGQTDVPVGLTEVVAISANRHGTIALKSDGTIVAWGGEPAPAELPPVFGIAAGGDHTLVIVGTPTLLRNPGFEGGVGGWEFYTNGQGTLSNDSPGYQGIASGRIDIDSPGSNIQLYQRGFALEPNTRYHLQFTAKSSTGHDLSVYLQQESSPNPSYGIRNFRTSLTDDWKTFTIYFTTKNFTTPTNDTRLRFWLAKLAQGGDVYWIDDLSLVKVTQQVTAAGTDLATGRLQGVVQGVNAPVPVTLIDLETDRAIATTTTGAAGGFEFVELVYGNYEVQLAPPAGYLTPEPVQLAVTAEPQEDLVFTLETATNQIYLPTIQR